MKVTRTFDFKEKGTVIASPDVKSLDEGAAELIVKSAASSIADRGRFTIALSGGSTPKPLYELLATEPYRDRIDWLRTHFFWSDERWVPSNDKQSNYRMVKEALLSKIPVPEENVHRIETDDGEPQESATQYEEDIRKFLGGRPRIDFNLLGLGANGHTASLFPGRPTLHIQDRLLVADYIPEVRMNRITFTVPLINDSRAIVFLAHGADKASVINDVLRGPHDPERLPAQLVRASDGALTWLVDADAAADLH